MEMYWKSIPGRRFTRLMNHLESSINCTEQENGSNYYYAFLKGIGGVEPLFDGENKPIGQNFLDVVVKIHDSADMHGQFSAIELAVGESPS